MLRTQVFSCISGSHLYGTNIAGSDIDKRSVSVPGFNDLVFIRDRSIVAEKKEDADTVDYELVRYMELVLNGQTEATELLFAPKDKILYISDDWQDILFNRDKFIGNFSAFVGYCKAQANKYCTKVERYNELKDILDIIKNLPSFYTVKSFHDGNERLKKHLHAFPPKNIVTAEGSQGQTETYLEVLGRRFSEHVELIYAYRCLRDLEEEYGKRVKSAADMGDKDWKSLMHALRIAEEAKELMDHSFITFPRPNWEYLKKIRMGEIAYEEIIEKIDEITSYLLSKEYNKKNTFGEILFKDIVTRVYLKHSLREFK